MRDKKQNLRVWVLLRREGLPASDLHAWNHFIRERVLLFPAYLESKSVILYSPIGNEVSTEGVCDHALWNGKKVFYPRLGKGEEMRAVRVKSREDLVSGRYGILEPVGSEFMTEQDQEALMVFIPGLAFDLEGNRLGRGRGFYDRFLKRLGERVPYVAWAYDFQIMAGLPVEKWDERVHYIITEKRIIDCGNVMTQSGYVL